MSILTLILIIVICGVVCWLVQQYAPMQQGFKTLIYVILLIVCVLYALEAFGIFANINAPVPRVSH